MARAVRVGLGPIQRSVGSQSVLGVQVSLERLGPGQSLAKFASPQPATITFEASCFAKARAPERDQRVERELAVLAGELSLDGALAEPLFAVKLEDSSGILDDGDDGAAADDSDDDPTARRLGLRLSEAHFTGISDESTALRLLVPSDLMQDAAHLELFATLRIAGAEEAPRDVNDVLDVPLKPRPRIRVRLVDEVGEPLASVAAEFATDAGVVAVTTDSDGIAEIDDTGSETTSFSIVDLESLQATLKERWSKPRSGTIVVANASVAVRIFSTSLGPFEIPAENPSQILSLQPPVVQARLLGLLFDTNKSFLLPSALPDMVLVKQLYDENPGSELLIVGHTDASSEPAVNDPLSLERAESMGAYLRDDADVWLSRYDTSVPSSRRWGALEDMAMLQSLPDFLQRAPNEDPVSFFQRTRGLTVTGKADSPFRRALILEYMSRDETTLPADVSITTHGCGEFFPLDEGTQANVNGAHIARDRRVELFFFANEFGILPQPPGKNSKQGSREYPEWRKRAKLALAIELALSDRALRVRLQLEGSPIADTEYAVDVDGRRLAIGRTDAEGLVFQRLPKDAELAVLRVPALNLVRSIQLTPAEEFPSADLVDGVQIRLAQLGFFAGEADGRLDQVTSDAIRAFKRSRGLADDDTYDDATQQELVNAYGS